MREHYIANKVDSLFPVKPFVEHVKHSANPLNRIKAERKRAEIIGFMHDEIEKASQEVTYKLTRMLNLCLKEKL